MSEQDPTPHVVIVWRTDGVGFERIIGPFATREEAQVYRLRFPLATSFPLSEVGR